MTKEQIINSTRAGMIRGKRFKPQEISKYEDVLRQQTNDDKVEVMMLYFAEVLHDELGFGMKRIQRILSKLDEQMLEWLEVDGFNIDNLRIRVFGKTNFLFVCDEVEHKRVLELLDQAGYKVKTEEDLL